MRREKRWGRPMGRKPENVAFVWDNFGPMHADRCEAVARTADNTRKVIGIELFSTSEEYGWHSETGQHFEKVTLYQEGSWRSVSALVLARKIVKACKENRVSDVFLCNYDKVAIFFAGMMLRALGKNVYVMGCSKFDDVERTIWKEAAKLVFFLPYQGAIASGKRSRDYMRFMGLPQSRIFTEYNTLSIERIRAMAKLPPAPAGMEFGDRHFTIVARFVPKKNISMALEAYSLYRREAQNPRSLHLCGSGPLEDELREKVLSLGLSDAVVFHGFLQTEDIARVLASTLALILPSTSEQFGNVVIEAQAMGLPVIISDVCGARDNLVRSGANGFVVEPDNHAGLAFFMRVLADEKETWEKFSRAAGTTAHCGDVALFAAASLKLVATLDTAP